MHSDYRFAVAICLEQRLPNQAFFRYCQQCWTQMPLPVRNSKRLHLPGIYSSPPSPHIHLSPPLTNMPCQPYTHSLLETSLIHGVITCTQLRLTREKCQGGGAHLVMPKAGRQHTQHPSGKSHLTSHASHANPGAFYCCHTMHHQFKSHICTPRFA